MSPRPDGLQTTGLPGVYRCAAGELWIRGSATLPDGRRREFGYRRAHHQGPRLSDAAIAYTEQRERKAALASGVAGHAPAASNMSTRTVREWFDACENDNISDSTRRNREVRSALFLEVLGDLPIATVTTADVERAWSAVLATNLAPNTLKVSRIYLRQPFNHAFRHGAIATNPTVAAELRIPRARRSRDVRQYALGHRELGPVFFAIHQRESESRRYLGRWLHLVILWSTGMRRGELEVAQLNWLTPGAASLWVPSGVEKAKRGRLVILAPWLAGLVREHVARMDLRDPDARLFTFSRDAVNLWWGRALESVGIPHGKQHGTSVGCLRHACRSTLESLGWRARLIDLMLGHGDQVVSDTYSLALEGEMLEAATAMAEYVRRGLQDEVSRQGVHTPSGYSAGTASAIHADLTLSSRSSDDSP